MQLTVRLPRWLATTLAIVVAAVGVAVVLPATASSDTTDRRLHRSGHEEPDRRPGLHRQHAYAGTSRGSQAPRAPPAPPDLPVRAGPPDPRCISRTSKPTLTAKIEAALEVQSATITDVNHDIRARSRSRTRSCRRPIRRSLGLQDAVKVQGTSIARLVNVLRALTKAQDQLLRGLE